MLWKIPPWIPGRQGVPAHWGSLPSSWHKHSASEALPGFACLLLLGCPFGILLKSWALEDVFPGIKAQGEHFLLDGKPQNQAGCELFTQETPGLTFLQDLQMFPKDIPHKVRCQLQEALLAQGTEGSSIHAELLEIHFLQAELVHCPHHPVPHVRLCPLLGVCRGISSEHPQAVFPGKSTQSMLQLPCTSTASSLEIGSLLASGCEEHHAQSGSALMWARFIQGFGSVWDF